MMYEYISTMNFTYKDFYDHAKEKVHGRWHHELPHRVIPTLATPLRLCLQLLHKKIHSFILETYIAPLLLFKRLLLRGAPSPVTDKEEGLERDVKFGSVDHQTSQRKDHSMLMDPQPKKP